MISPPKLSFGAKTLLLEAVENSSVEGCSRRDFLKGIVTVGGVAFFSVALNAPAREAGALMDCSCYSNCYTNCHGDCGRKLW